MNKPITPQQMSTWIDDQWQKRQDEAWQRLKQILEADPELMEVFNRMKDK